MGFVHVFGRPLSHAKFCVWGFLMTVADFFGGFSPVEIVIVGFIGANMLLSGIFVLQMGAKRLQSTESPGE